MRKSGPSRTAEQVALFRAIESGRRRARLFTDPYARSFLGPAYLSVAQLARLPLVGQLIPIVIDALWPAGPRASAVARTKLIDDLLIKALASGVEQVLLLGAGYDSRAYRIAEAERVRVFEVDHPATQRVKRQLIEKLTSPEQRAYVRFVPIDLARDDRDAPLREAGFTVSRTFVIWEGVTDYLTSEAVDQTLRWLVAATAAGSEIVFTYMDRRALDGSAEFVGFKQWARTVRKAGEPITFGFVPSELAGYLADRGLRLLLDLSTWEAAVRYLEPLGRREPAARFYHIAHVAVP